MYAKFQKNKNRIKAFHFTPPYPYKPPYGLHFGIVFLVSLYLRCQKHLLTKGHTHRFSGSGSILLSQSLRTGSSHF